MTVKSVIDAYTGETGVAVHEQSARAMVATRHAEGYLAGVADASEGRSWCDQGTVKVDEIDSIVVGELRKLPPEKQQRAAAPEILKILATKFPCKQGKQ
ncbi:Rap1a/Tai family immunity protein [Caldimonas brevitalea]|nr:Rap1a/Tai family immunity protein [Caldimonas brevitalea]